MVELDDATRRALSQHYGPQARSQAQVLANLRAQFGGPVGPEGAEGSPGPEPTLDPLGPAANSVTTTGQGLWVVKVIAATLGLTGAGLLSLSLGALALGGAKEAPPPLAPTAPLAPNAAVTSIESESAAASTPVAAPDPVAAPVPVAALEVPAMHTPRPTRTISPQAIRSASSPSVASEVGTDLSAELALIRAAQRLVADAPREALPQLEQHLRAFPRGQLAPEREVLRIEIACVLGRHEQATSLGAAFSTTGASPALRARVEASCVGTGLDGSGH